jgi:GNAT superfamily N-acetyltransferase
MSDPHVPAGNVTTIENGWVVRRASRNEAAAALSVLLEAAQWGIHRNLPVWDPGQLSEASFSAAAVANELVLGYAGDTPVATMLLQSSDPIHWPEAAPGSALYLHKVAVRRAWAGQGWLPRLVEFAIRDARGRRISRLRLDTIHRPKLQSMYERLGFCVIPEEPRLLDGQCIIRMERTL